MNLMPFYRLLIGVFVLISFPVLGQDDLACNNNVQVSLDANCTALITPDVLLENYEPSLNYSVEVLDELGQSTGSTVDNSDLGLTRSVQVHLLDASGSSLNFCWGTIIVEDKLAPSFICPTLPTTISCLDNIDSVLAPTANDNCDTNPSIQLTDESIDTNDQCNDITSGDNIAGTVSITRTFVATDLSGNVSSPCLQTIIIERPSIIDFPDDIAWYCSQYATYPNIVNSIPLAYNSLVPNPAFGGALDATDILLNSNLLSITGSGQPSISEGNYCNYGSSYSEEIIVTCGNSFKIIRTWAVLDWCTSSLILFNDLNDDGIQQANEEDNIQTIKIVDDLAPIISATDLSLEITHAGNHPQACTSRDFIPFPTVNDDCSDVTIRIFTELGEVEYASIGGNIPAPGLELGTHLITYQATDACSNTSELTVNLEVIDAATPEMICDELTQVSLSDNGIALVDAIEFDDGTTDNCGIDYFEVRRTDNNCSIPSNIIWDESVAFCCADLNDTVQVNLRAFDFYGNVNECSVSVLVEDKLAPQKLSGISNQSINCDDYLTNLKVELDLAELNNESNPSILNTVFGEPNYEDNCDFSIQYFYTNTVNNCGQGQILRQWTPVDESGNIGEVCVQTIDVIHTSNFSVQFPADINFECGADTNVDYGYPNITNDDCELIAISYEDLQFDIVDDACFKIIRTWTVINWCTPNDIRQHTQEIKVVDNEAPSIIADQTSFVYEIDGAECSTTVNLPVFPTQDCSDDVDLIVVSDLGEGFGPFENVPEGQYSATYTATDNCGNQYSIEITFEVVDTKPPTPYCVASFNAALMATGMVDICTDQLDAGGFDNCTAPEDLIFTFDPNDPNANCITFNCLHINDELITPVYIIDEAGNFDVCLVDINVQDNQLVCIARPEILGRIENIDGEAIPAVSVQLNADDNATQVSDNDGNYAFLDLESGLDYTLIPTEMNTDYDEGVTTWDLVLIRQHILNLNVLDSPYKIIAADANNSGSVTTSDIIALRRILLQMDDELANSPSQRFVPKDYEFPNPANPWENGNFPEFINFNNLSTTETADFIGIKIGNVNE